MPTSLVGSYAQPEWLIDRAKLAGRFPPRVRAKELWRVDPEHLAEAQDDATLLAIRAQEEAGLDIITDGEMRRESYSNHFATALEGVDIDNPGTALDRSGHPNPVPRIAGPIERTAADRGRGREVPAGAHRPHHQDDRARTVHDVPAGPERPLPRPGVGRDGVRRSGQRRDQDLHAAGADIVQMDEPYMQARPDDARAYGLEALEAALDGVTGTTAVHICFGYAAIIHSRPEGYSFLPELGGCSADQISIETAQSGLDLGVLADLADKTVILGVIDLSDHEVETADTVADRVRRAFAYTTPDKITIATDCGMKYLPAGERRRKAASHGRRGGHPARGAVAATSASVVEEVPQQPSRNHTTTWFRDARWRSLLNHRGRGNRWLRRAAKARLETTRSCGFETLADARSSTTKGEIGGQSSDCTPASSWRAITMRCTWLVPS